MKELKQIAVGLALMLAISAPVIAQTVIGAGGARAGRGQGRGQGARGGGLATMPVATLSYFVTLKDDRGKDPEGRARSVGSLLYGIG